MTRSELPDRQVFPTFLAENANNGPPLDHVPVARQARRRDLLPALVIGLMLTAGALGLFMGWPK